MNFIRSNNWTVTACCCNLALLFRDMYREDLHNSMQHVFSVNVEKTELAARELEHSARLRELRKNNDAPQRRWQ